jgi:hypothetical protein
MPDGKSALHAGEAYAGVRRNMVRRVFVKAGRPLELHAVARTASHGGHCQGCLGSRGRMAMIKPCEKESGSPANAGRLTPGAAVKPH